MARDPHPTDGCRGILAGCAITVLVAVVGAVVTAMVVTAVVR